MSPKEFLKYAFYLSPFILVIGVLIGSFKYHKLSGINKLLFKYLIICLGTDLIGRFVAAYWGSNLIMVPIFGAFELLIFSVVYIKYMLKYRKWMVPFILVMFVLLLIDLGLVLSKSVVNFQSYARVIDCLGIMILSLTFFAQNITNTITPKKRLLLLNTILLLYCSIELLVFLPLNFIINLKSDSDFRLAIWGLHFTNTLVLYTILIISIWKSGKNHKHLQFGF